MIPSMATKPKLGDEVMVSYLFFCTFCNCLSQALDSKQRRRPVFGARRLKYQFIQKWHENISEGGKCTVYRIIKTSFGFENYLNELPDLLSKYYTV